VATLMTNFGFGPPPWPEDPCAAQAGLAAVSLVLRG
jgi:hypothetical protein